MTTSSSRGSLYPDKKRLGPNGKPRSFIGEITIDGQRRRVRAATKKDAWAKLNRLVAAADRDGVAADGNVTVGALIDRWLAGGMPRNGAPKTIALNEWAADVMRSELGARRARTLTPRHVERSLANIAAGKRSRHGRPASRRQLVLMRATLRRVLTYAARRNELSGPAVNAAAYADLPHDAPERVPRNALDAEQARVLMGALNGERIGPMFQLMLLTGLRPGEAAALRWDAVELTTEPPNVQVRRALQMDGDRARISEHLKTRASRRTVALVPEAVEILTSQRRRNNEARASAPNSADPELVFATGAGTPWHPKNSRRELARISSQAGLPRVRPNELRHSCASLLSDRGVPHALIADLLGHTTTRMVDETYRHNLRNVSDAAVAGRLGDLWPAQN